MDSTRRVARTMSSKDEGMVINGSNGGPRGGSDMPEAHHCLGIGTDGAEIHIVHRRCNCLVPRFQKGTTVSTCLKQSSRGGLRLTITRFTLRKLTLLDASLLLVCRHYFRPIQNVSTGQQRRRTKTKARITDSITALKVSTGRSIPYDT